MRIEGFQLRIHMLYIYFKVSDDSEADENTFTEKTMFVESFGKLYFNFF